MLRLILAFVSYSKIGTMTDSTKFLWLWQSRNIVALQVELLNFLLKQTFGCLKFKIQVSTEIFPFALNLGA